MQEERAAAWGYVPVNATPYVGATRDVFDDDVAFSEGVFEWNPVRLRQAAPSNEVACLPKDDVSRSCPQLLPPEPVTAAPQGWCGAPGGGDAPAFPNPGMLGDEYVLNFGQPAGNEDLFFPTTVGNYAWNSTAAAAKAKWYFPKAPAGTSLKRRPDGKGLAVKAGSLGLTLAKGHAGAISSIKYGTTEFLNAAPKTPKSPSLQMSVAVNVPPGGNDQQRRANEAGAMADRGPSSSRLLGLWAGTVGGKQVAFTRAQAAWWRRPGAAAPGGGRVLTGGTASPFVVTKRVSAFDGGFTYRGGVTLPSSEDPRSVRVALRFALRQSYNRVLAFQASTRRWVALPRSRTLEVDQYRALVVTNAKGDRALGLTLRDFPKPPASLKLRPRAYYAVNVTNRASPGTLVSVVHQVGVRGAQTPLPAKTWAYDVAFRVGTLAAVTKQLATIAVNLAPWSQAEQLGPGGLAALKAASPLNAPVCRQPASWKPAPVSVLDTDGDLLTGDLGDLSSGDLDDLDDGAPLTGGGAVAGGSAGGGGVVVGGGNQVRFCTVKNAARCKRNKCSATNVNKAGCGGCFDCRTVPRGSVTTRCTVKNAARCKKNGCTVANRGKAGCGGCVTCVATAKPSTTTKPPAGHAGQVKKCTVKNAARCKKNGCTAANPNKAGCGGCLSCAWVAKPAAAAKKRVCTVKAAARCKKNKCTTANPNKAGCGGCLSCRMVSVHATMKPPRTVRKCSVKPAPRCKGCKVNDKAAKCKGCTACKNVVVATTKPPGTKKPKCYVKKTAACKGCGLYAKRAACKGCTVCATQKPATAKPRCTVKKTAACKGCGVNAKRAACKGCTVCSSSVTPTAKVKQTCLLSNQPRCRACKVGDDKGACKGCTTCTKAKGTKTCMVQKTAACKGCKLGTNAGKCRGCTICDPGFLATKKATAKATAKATMKATKKATAAPKKKK